MTKRKSEDDPLTRQKLKIDCPDIAPSHFKHNIRTAPTTLSSLPIDSKLLKKRKRLEECEAESSRDREARRIKLSHGGSNPSPASKYIFSKIEDKDEEQNPALDLSKNGEGRTAFPPSPTPYDNSTSAKENTTITTDVVLPIRPARPQTQDPAFTNLSERKKTEKKQTKNKQTQQQVQKSNKKWQPRKCGQQKQRKCRQQKQRSPEIPTQIQDSFLEQSSRYERWNSILERWKLMEHNLNLELHIR